MTDSTNVEPVIEVKGHCPACGAEALELFHGYVMCSAEGCPNPDIISVLLEDEEIQHVVSVTGAGFTLRHPLRERAGTDLFDCAMHVLVSEWGPMPGGLYRVTVVDEELVWELLPIAR